MTRAAAIAAAIALALAGLGARPARAETACADLAGAVIAGDSLKQIKVTAATTETVGQSQACKVEVTSRPSPDSDIRIEVWIPVGAAWNGAFVQLGNGGFAGQIPSGQLKALAARGYAVAGADDGHQSANVTDASWALGHPEKVVDFAWRALKQTTDVASALIVAQKGSVAHKSFFYGCSDGGREALMEAQRFPADFNGIIAGAPAYDMSDLFGQGATNQQALARPGGYLGADQRALLQSAALAQCAGGGAFIRDPAACRFDPATLACKPGQDPAKCLTPGQLETARVIYGGFKDPRTGQLLSPGFSPGAEALPGSWPLWTTGASEDKRAGALNYMFSSNAFRYFAFGDASFDMLKLDLGAEFQRGLKHTRVLDSIDPDLKAFRDHGGKLINFHGWNDPAIPPKASIAYYERMARATGRPESFYRLYLVPGMLHCGGGPGPSDVDWLAVLQDWVKTGQAPGALTAKGAGGASQTLCPYPAAAPGGACVRR
jgi:feruloyl esterase